MIIWSGLGFLVAVIAFGCLVASEFAVESIFQDDQYYQTHGWPKLLALLVAGIIVWLLGRRLKGGEARNRAGHSLFFIPFEYWGPILIVLGFIFMFVE